MNILFVCKHNRFRSKVAELIFRKLNINNRNEAKSAGVQLDFLRPYVEENVKRILEKRGYNVNNELPRQINEFDLKWAYKIVIVANNVSPDLFKEFKREIEVWDIGDCDTSDKKMIEEIIKKIEEKVKGLVDNLR